MICRFAFALVVGCFACSAAAYSMNPVDLGRLVLESDKGKAPISPQNKVEFYVLGWSKSGNLLGALEYTTHAMAGHMAHFRIINLVNDRITFQKRWQWDTDGTRAEQWHNAVIEAKAELKQRSFRLMANEDSPPLVRRFSNGQSLQTDLQFAYQKSIALTLSQEKERKVIYQAQLKDEHEFDRSLSFNVIGYLASPNNERIAVLVSRIMRGLEGEIRREILVSGAGIGSRF